MQARTMASPWGGTPVELSQRTRVTTARAICLAMPAWRLSSWSIRPWGRRGAAGWALGLGAIFAIRSDYKGLAVLLHEVQHSPPRVVAGVLPLGERAVEEAVRRTLVD